MTFAGPFTTGPNLEPARKAVEKLMDDVLYITTNAFWNRGAALDEESGELMRLSDPDALQYEGKGKVSHDGAMARQSELADTTQVVSRYVGAIPIGDGSYIPAVGDIVQVEYSRRDPNAAQGGPFVITELIYSTFAVSRKFKMEAQQVIV